MFKELLQNLKVGIVIHASDTTVKFSNPEASRLLGLSKEQMQGRASIDAAWHFIREDDSPLPLEEYPVNLVLKTLQPLDEYVMGIIRPGNGDRTWVLIRAFPEFDPSHELERIIVTFIDITIRKQTEKSLLLTQFAIDNASDAIFWVTPDGKIVDVNKKGCKHLGYAREELLKLTVHDIDALYDANKWQDHFIELRQHGSLRFETEHRTQDGRIVPVEIVANYLKFGEKELNCAFVRDISERKQAENAVRESEKTYRRLFETMLQGVVYQGADGQIISANPAAERILGLSYDQLLGKTSLDPDWKTIREDGSELPGHEHPAMVALQTGKPVEHVIMGVMNPTVNLHTWISVNAIPLFRSGESKPFQVYATLEDITERKQVEQKLKESEERFKALHNASFGGICIHDKGIILECNQGLSAMSGYSLDELIGMNGLLLVAPNSREFVMNHIVSGYEKPYEAFGIRKNGEIYPMRLEARNIPYKGKQARTVEFRDITDSKKAAEALRESEATIKKKLQSILEPEGDIGTLNLSDIIDQEALQTMLEGFYQLTHISGALLDISGKVLVAFGWQDICTRFHRIHPDTQRNCLESDVNLASGVPVGTFKAYKCKNNMWDMVTPIEIGGKHLGNFYLGQFFFDDEVPDLELFRNQCHQYGFNEKEYLAALARVPYMSRETINKAIEFCGELTGMISSLSYSKIKIARALSQKDIVLSKLCESEAKLNALFASMTEMVVLHELVLNEQGETINYRIIDCNDSFTKVTGIKKDNAKGKLATEVYQVDNAPYLKEFSKVAISGEPYKYTTYFPPMNKHFSISVVSPKQNQFATVTTDITAIKQIQEIVTSKNKELESYLYIASHDLRSPLVNIQGFSQRLQKQIDSIVTLLAGSELLAATKASIENIANSGIPRTLNYIFSNVKKMDALLNGLLQVSRMGRAVMTIKKIDMNRLIKEIITEHNFQITEVSAQVLIKELPHCYGDENLLNQLFANIIGNAIKYRDSSRQLQIEISATSAFDKIIFSVKDNGMGIEERYIDKIWNVFYQIDSTVADSGEGLGLSVVKKVAEKHQGKVWVESESGKGSVFYIELPATNFREQE